MNQQPIPPQQHTQQQQLIDQLQQENEQQQQLIHELLEQQQQQQQQQPDGQQQDAVEPEAVVVQPPTTSREMVTAIDANDSGKIISLVEAGENPNSVDEFGHTAIMKAIWKGMLKSVRALFGWGASLSSVDIHGLNVLHHAAGGGHLDCIKWVLANSPSGLNSTNSNGWTPVLYALRLGKIGAAKELFGRGADLLRITNDGENALHCAAMGGDQECVQWVLATAATLNVNTGDNDGDTPIARAMWYNKSSAAKLLAENGANLFAKNQNGEAAIDTRVDNEPDGEQLGPQVLEHAKAIRRSAAKECILLSNAFQSPERRQIANPSTSIYDDDLVVRSARLAASVLGDPGLSRLVASYILRTDIIVRDRFIILEKEPDEVKKRIEAALGSLSIGDGGSSSARSH
jgi:ankyrin repeat protein